MNNNVIQEKQTQNSSQKNPEFQISHLKKLAAMAAIHGLRLLWPPFVLPLFFLMLSPTPIDSVTEADALLKFKKSFTNAASLASWSQSSSPCGKEKKWDGLVCVHGIVTGLRLEGLGLSGKFDVEALLQIPGLRTLSFKNNNFSGSIPEFNKLGALKTIYLNENQFSGEIPSDYFKKMESLKKIWLSDNKFSGGIPSSVTKLSHLIELHLQNNQFSGTIPPIDDKTTLVSFNVSNNKLEGEIPASLSEFDASSFSGNADLCGEKVGKSCDQPADDSKNATTPSPKQKDGTKNGNPNNYTKIAIAILTSVIVLLFTAFLVIWIMRRREEKFDLLGRENHLDEAVEVHVSGSSKKDGGSGGVGVGNELSKKGNGSSRRGGSSHGKGGGGGGGGGSMGDLIIVNDEKGMFGLTDLMKAAAEVLGNGGLGSAYKAMMLNGVTVVVKRMRDMNKLGKDGFDTEVRKLGRLRHWNILTPLAYHYRRDEKLLVYEHIPKGSLLYLLHGDRGPSHADLDWPARLKIVQGIAKGLNYLHTELSFSDLPHGNLKSSNVLINSNNEPLLSDYGYHPLINTNQVSQALFAYKAPEAAQYRHISPKCDVYCLGIIILEVLTGKFPSQYVNNGKGGTNVVEWVASSISEGRESELFDPDISNSKNSIGEMDQLLQIGAACTESNPDQRLDLREAIRMIDEIQTDGGGEQEESRTIQYLPSLRDGYADVPLSATASSSSSSASASQTRATTSFTEEYGQLSGKKRLDSLNDRLGRGNGDSFAFAIS